MAISTTLFLLAMSLLAPTITSAPVLAQEECVCQPMEGQNLSNSSLASCSKIAQSIQQWRALSFHSPYLADAFVDAEQHVQVSREGKPFEKAQAPHKSSCHHPAAPQGAFDQAVRKLFQQWKNPTSQKAITPRRVSLETPTLSRLLGPVRPAWPWEKSENEDKSPGRKVDETSSPAFLKSAQRYRILCRAKLSSETSYSSAWASQLMLLAALAFVVVCMTILDVFVVSWRVYSWATQGTTEGFVALTGDERQIWAHPIEIKIKSVQEESKPTEKETFNNAVVPAVSDL